MGFSSPNPRCILFGLSKEQDSISLRLTFSLRDAFQVPRP